MALCKSCEAEVVWCTTLSGKKMPMDAKPDPKGTFVIVKGTARTANDEDRELHRDLHTSHFATCADAADWRSKR